VYIFNMNSKKLKKHNSKRTIVGSTPPQKATPQMMKRLSTMKTADKVVSKAIETISLCKLTKKSEPIV